MRNTVELISTMKAKTKTESSVRARMEPDLREALESESKKRGINLSVVIRIACRNWLKNPVI